MEYAIYEGNMERLEKKLTRIFNKCKAYGCDFHYQQTGEVFKELKDENGKTYNARFVLVEAEGTAVINDWEFIAEVDHTEKVKFCQKQLDNALYNRSQYKKSTPLHKSDGWEHYNAYVKQFRQEMREIKALLRSRQSDFDKNIRNKEFYKKVLQIIT